MFVYENNNAECEHRIGIGRSCSECARERGKAMTADLKAAKKDAAFYRSCALSGEIPTEGSEPSAQVTP